MEIKLLHYFTLKGCRILCIHIRESQKTGRDLDIILSSPLCSRVTQSQLPRTISKWLLSAPRWETPQYLRAACWSARSPQQQNCFLMFIRSLLCFTLSPWPLILSLGTTESLASSSLCLSLKYLCILQDPLEPFLLLAKYSQLSEPSFMQELLQSLSRLCSIIIIISWPQL